jgi:hypothetical protein
LKNYPFVNIFEGQTAPKLSPIDESAKRRSQAFLKELVRTSVPAVISHFSDVKFAWHRFHFRRLISEGSVEKANFVSASGNSPEFPSVRGLTDDRGHRSQHSSVPNVTIE